MAIMIKNHGDFEIVSAGHSAAIVRGDKIGPLFRNVTDAYDWAFDTELGARKISGYDITPLRGDAARVILAALAMAYKAARA